MAIVASKPKALSIKALRITASRISAVISDAICRWFSNFNGVDSYAQFTSNVIIADGEDFEISIVARTTEVAGGRTQILMGNMSDTSPVINYESNGDLRIRTLTGVRIAGASPILSNGDICTFARVSNVGTIRVNDDLIVTGALTGGLVFNSIGAYDSSSFFFAGQLSDLEIWQNGTSTTGTKIVDMPMDERYIDIHGEIIYNNLAAQDAWYLELMGGSNINSNFTATTSFMIEIELSTTLNNTSVQGLWGRHSGDRCYIGVENGSIIIGNGTGGLNTTRSVDDGVDRILKFYNDNGDLVASLNNVEIYRQPLIFSFPIQVDLIGRITDWVSPANVNFQGNIKSYKATADNVMIIDYDFQSLSNVIPNLASTTSANLWVGTRAATGQSSIVDANTINVLRTNATNSQVSVVAAVTGLDVLIYVTVASGSLDNIICGDSTTEFTTWYSVYGVNKVVIPNRFVTLMSNNDAEILFKTNGVANVFLSDITAQTVTGYGVLSGAKYVDWIPKNDSPNATGFNITTEQDPVCAGLIWIDGEGWVDDDRWTD